jgi:hypothetical protein
MEDIVALGTLVTTTTIVTTTNPQRYNLAVWMFTRGRKDLPALVRHVLGIELEGIGGYSQERNDKDARSPCGAASD